MQKAGRTLDVAILQLPVCNEVARNISGAISSIKEVKTKNPSVRLVILPESFNAPYGDAYFAKYAEEIPSGKSCRALSDVAKALGIYIVGGSIIEKADDGKLYNTCTIWGPKGQLIGRHRKIHLFTINISIEHCGGVSFDESRVLSAGNEVTIVDIDGHKAGIGICHDKRFDELARIYRNQGCDMLIYPSAFCICQGPMHWELLQRARATDNQCFVLTCSPARDNMSGYVAYGHSMIVDPWARVQREAGETPEIIVEQIDFGMVDSVRHQIPLFPQRRLDVYRSAHEEKYVD